MVFNRLASLLRAVAIGFVAVVVLGVAAIPPALALEGAGSEAAYLDRLAQAQVLDDFYFVALFADDAAVQMTDVGGNAIGEGLHGGRVLCNHSVCSWQTYLRLHADSAEPAVYEYKFKIRQAIDPVAERVFVEGNGTISDHGQKERFSFSAIFQNNRDGTIWIRYEASRPDASFIVPNAPGTFGIFSR